MEELSRLRSQAEALVTRRDSGLAPSHWEGIRQAFGADGYLQERGDGYFQIATACFRAGLFADASTYFRRWHDSQEQLAQVHARRGDVEARLYVREELARHAWAFADMDTFAAYVREGCEPREGVTPRLEVLSALFMAWAVLGRRFHADHWIKTWLATAEEERLRIRAAWKDDREAAAVVDAVTVDAKMARGWYWLAEHDRALRHCRAARDGFARLARVRPRGLVVHEKRTWRRRMEGLEELLRGRTDASHLPAAVTAFTKALAASASVRGHDWKDLVLLHLTARAWRDPGDPLVTDFARHFPRLVPALARQPRWTA
jgi:hypothetical protein